MNAKFGGAAHDAHTWSSSRVDSYMREPYQRNEQVGIIIITSIQNNKIVNINSNFISLHSGQIISPQNKAL